MQKRIDRRSLSKLMTSVYGGTDSENYWSWKDAYDAAECAELIHIRDYLSGRLDDNNLVNLKTLEDLQSLQPSHTIRSEGQNERQQFSTPIALAYLCSLAAQILPSDTVLEPSAGHGTLALFAKLRKAKLLINEIDRRRAEACAWLFKQSVYQEDAAYIDDLLGTPIKPSVVIMNPPFSSSLKRGKNKHETGIHILSAIKRLAPGGRLVAIVGYNFNPSSLTYSGAWTKILENCTLTGSIGLSKNVFQSKGTSFATRILVIDKGQQPVLTHGDADTLEDALSFIEDIAPRLDFDDEIIPTAAKPKRARKPAKRKGPIFTLTKRSGELVEYSENKSPVENIKTNSLYVPYTPQRIKIKDAQAHPSSLTQSIGLASIVPPMPSYKPNIPKKLVETGALSDAQLEVIIYAGEAHSQHLKGRFVYDSEKNNIGLAPPDATDDFTIRKGFAIADSTGVGKGREISGIILDNWIKGERKAIWISKSSNLINDARRDLIDLGFSPNEIFAQGDYDYGDKIARTEGVLFTTFALIRGEAKDDRDTRLQQLIEWAGDAYSGVIAFDEGHAMANAVVGTTDRGEGQASLQGQAGLKLQFVLNDARVLYSSATSATTVENLGYMDRLGLWRGIDAPFDTRAEFIQSMSDGGVAALEVAARDLKAMGLYFARNISFDGVEYQPLIHQLSEAQTHIYNQFADAFGHIHRNLEQALEAINVKEDGATKNKNAVGAARSAFESTKQRFFNHLLTSMKMPTVIKQMKQDLEDGYAVVGQLVSTGEAILTRRLAAVDPIDIIEGNVDMTPKDAIIEYLERSFPTQLFEIVLTASGHETAEPVFDADGNAVQSVEAMQRKADLMERLCSLPSIPSALDQIIWHFGADKVAEITGRSKRIIKRKQLGRDAVEIQSRPGSANNSELNAFMDGKKDIVLFSRSGAIGFSMHASLVRKNQKRRAQYIIEAGWSADAAVQGLGRSHRSNQACAPLFRPVSTDVQGEKRFLSTISRRLNTLGAITKGERKTGGQNLFRPEDNLESKEAREALGIFFKRLHAEPQAGITLKRFQEMTGLSLTDKDGTLNENLPPIQRFLNRLLALRIEDQNVLFTVFMEIIDNRVELAKAAGTLDVGAETIKADSVEVTSEIILRRDPNNGAVTKLLQIKRQTRNKPTTLDNISALRLGKHRLVFNSKSRAVAIVTPTTGYTDAESGRVITRFKITRPTEWYRTSVKLFEESAYDEIDEKTFEQLWRSEVKAVPEFTTDQFGIVTGLIMPLWSTLKGQRQTVYRLNTETHGSVLGRYIAPSLIDTLLQVTGAEGGTEMMTPEAVLTSLWAGEEYVINDECYIKISKMMDDKRIEIRGYEPHWLPTLKSIGCFTEIVQFRTRLFIPNTEQASSIIGQIQSRYQSI